MTDRELHDVLRSARLPDRDEAYWREFPNAVLRRVQAARGKQRISAARPAGEVAWLGRWGWVMALGAACALVALAVWVRGPTRPAHETDAQLAALRQYYHGVAELFPGQLEALVLDAESPQVQLAESATLSNAPPLFVRVCDPSSRCVAVVTFSGQRLELLGRSFEVLADSRGKIFFMAKEGVWSPGQSPGGGAWRFEAGWLEQAL